MTLGSEFLVFFIGTQETNHEPGVLRFALDYFPSFPEHRMMCSSIMQLKCSYFCIMYFETTLWVAEAGGVFFFTSGFLFLFFFISSCLYLNPTNCPHCPNTKRNYFSFIISMSTLLLSLSPSLLLPFFFTHLSAGAPPNRNLVCFKVVP